MIRLAIIEDEPKIRSFIRSIIEETFGHIAIVGEADSVETGLQLIREHDIQVILLDVQLPDGTGFDLLSKTGASRPHVIFVTAYNHYAIKAIREGAVDYIEKPINPAFLIAGIQRVETLIQKQEIPSYEYLKRLFTQPPPEKIAVPTRLGTLYIETQNIIYIEADRGYTKIFMVQQEKPLMVSKNLKQIHTTLEPFGFVRIHRSYLVNVSKIKLLNKTDGGFVVLENGAEIPFSKHYKESALAELKKQSTSI